MTPIDPQSPATPPNAAFWDYQDLFLLIALFLPSLVISVLAARVLFGWVPFGKAFVGLLAQSVLYLLFFFSLYGLLRLRYGQPFWSSLGWRPLAFTNSALCFFGGPALALAIGYVGYALRTPEIDLPFQQMLQDRPTLILFAIFVVVLGPLCEELAFRGFLLPLLIRSFGAVSGVVATGVLFGCLHAYEYAWSWRHVLLISAAGAIFGWVRYRTGSTLAATYVHSTYNLTQFVAFLAQSRIA